MNIDYKTFRCITITGKMKERQKINKWLDKNKYEVLRNGPKRISIDKVDLNVFLVRGKKRIK